MIQASIIKSEQLSFGWHVFRTPAGALDHPEELAKLVPDFETSIPCTVASLLGNSRTAKQGIDESIDRYDWWFASGEFDLETCHPARLRFDGLATLAEVWLDSERILTSSNMFRSYSVDIDQRGINGKRLFMVFRSLREALTARRPRPRWKTNLVENQQLRWHRVSLLGLMPGWSSQGSVIGPWREIRLNSGNFQLDRHIARASLEGTDGRLDLAIKLAASDQALEGVEMCVEIDGKQYPLRTLSNASITEMSGSIRVPNVSPWSPHTHGEPCLYQYKVIARQPNGGNAIQLCEGRIGFRKVELERDSKNVAILINGERVFCRGACWTVGDTGSLPAKSSATRETLIAMRDAGANMIRVGGTMLYESDEFYQYCDELGILVWQDFMFANMDYPADDPVFREEVESEVCEQVTRLSRFACVVCYCGGSEIEQQAAFVGVSEKDYANPIFQKTIPDILAELDPGKPYFASSPTGGAMPFYTREGISHYFGIGAYKRPVSDAVHGGVLFATECLGFSNVPSEQFVKRHFGSSIPAVHHPDWKKGVPRDSGAGWDFEDIRDHYFREYFGADPVALRYSDKFRYLQLSRIVTGEMMRQAFSAWRRRDNPCSGALIWFAKDIVPGAGWGILDSDGQPKAAYYLVKRAWAARRLSIVDQGLDGLSIEVQNEGSRSFKGTINIQLLRGHIPILITVQDLVLPAGGEVEFCLEQLAGRFLDANASYRFGPLQHDVVVASLIDEQACAVSVDAFFPGGPNLAMQSELPLTIDVEDCGSIVRFRLESEAFLQFVELTSNHLHFEDNYFHMAPGVPFTVTASKKGTEEGKYRGTVSALNFSSVLPLG